jgi:hypothetical protein
VKFQRTPGSTSFIPDFTNVAFRQYLYDRSAGGTVQVSAHQLWLAVPRRCPVNYRSQVVEGKAGAKGGTRTPTVLPARS